MTCAETAAPPPQPALHPLDLPGVRAATEAERSGYQPDLGPWAWTGSWPWSCVCAGIAAEVSPETVQAALWPDDTEWPRNSQIGWLQQRGFTQANLIGPDSPEDAYVGGEDEARFARLSHLAPDRRGYLLVWVPSSPSVSPRSGLLPNLGDWWTAAWDGRRVVVADQLMQMEDRNGQRERWGDGWRLALALMAPEPTA